MPLAGVWFYLDHISQDVSLLLQWVTPITTNTLMCWKHLKWPTNEDIKYIFSLASLQLQSQAEYLYIHLHHQTKSNCRAENCSISRRNKSNVTCFDCSDVQGSELISEGEKFGPEEKWESQGQERFPRSSLSGLSNIQSFWNLDWNPSFPHKWGGNCADSQRRKHTTVQAFSFVSLIHWS